MPGNNMQQQSPLSRHACCPSLWLPRPTLHSNFLLREHRECMVSLTLCRKNMLAQVIRTDSLIRDNSMPVCRHTALLHQAPVAILKPKATYAQGYNPQGMSRQSSQDSRPTRRPPQVNHLLLVCLRHRQPPTPGYRHGREQPRLHRTAVPATTEEQSDSDQET